MASHARKWVQSWQSEPAPIESEVCFKTTAAGNCAFWLVLSLLRLPPRGEAFPPPTGNTFSRKTSKHKQNAGWEWMGVQNGLNVTKPGAGFPLAKNPSKLAPLPNSKSKTTGRRWQIPDLRITWFSHKNVPGYRLLLCTSDLSGWRRAIKGCMATGRLGRVRSSLRPQLQFIVWPLWFKWWCPRTFLRDYSGTMRDFLAPVSNNWTRAWKPSVFVSWHHDPVPHRLCIWFPFYLQAMKNLSPLEGEEARPETHFSRL